MARKKREKTTRDAASGAALWRRVVVDVGQDASEAVQAALLEEGALGLEIEDDETRAMPGVALAPTGRVTVIGTFSQEPGLEARVVAALTPLANFFDGAKDMEVAWSDLFPEDWNEAFKREWKPLLLTEHIVVVPTWERETYAPPEGAIPLYLDPGLAFGTGTHETTQLCAEALDALLGERPIHHLLDVGTGTGILSLVALKLGAKRARGTEIDPVALFAARANADENGVGVRFETSLELPDAWGPVHDVVVANILAEPLLTLAPRIAAALAPTGRLFLSGLLSDQAKTVRRAYEREGLSFVRQVQKNGWVRLDLEKRAG